MARPHLTHGASELPQALSTKTISCVLFLVLIQYNKRDTNMRLNIRDIIEILNCSEDHAEKVEDEIDRTYALDWSECSQAQLRSEVVIANAKLAQR